MSISAHRRPLPYRPGCLLGLALLSVPPTLATAAPAARSVPVRLIERPAVPAAGLRLVSAAPLVSSTVELTVRGAPNAVLFIDDKQVGTLSGGADTFQIAPGLHRVVARLGTRTAKADIQAVPGTRPGVLFRVDREESEQYRLLPILPLLNGIEDAPLLGRARPGQPPLIDQLDSALVEEGGKLLSRASAESASPAERLCAQDPQCMLSRGSAANADYVLSLVPGVPGGRPNAEGTGSYQVVLLDVAAGAVSIEKRVDCTETASCASLLVQAATSVFRDRKSRGGLTLRSLPSRVDVNIDGERRGQTPLQLELFVGSHTVEVSGRFLSPVRQSFDISENGRALWSPQLQPAPPTAGERFATVGKWLFAGLGVAAVAAGAALVATDGAHLPYESGKEVRLQKTLAGGAALLASGAGSLVLAGVLFGVHGKIQKDRRAVLSRRD